MTLYPAAAALLLIWLIMAIRDPDGPVRLTIILLPFGMFAAIDAGGLSLLAAHLVAALAMVQVSLRFFRAKAGGPELHLPPAGIALLFFSLYSAIAAILLVRLFAGQFLIFPMTVSRNGIRVSDFFPSTLALIGPSNSNISQTLYIILSTMVFFCAYGLARRRGPNFVESALVWAALVNLILGLLDLAALDPLLSIIRTAHYTLNNEHTLAGLPRVIGGFPEASAFGAFSAALFAYFAASFLIRRRARDGALALAMLICALISLSSSGIVSALAAGFFVCLHMRYWLGSGISRSFGHWLVIWLMAAITLISLLMLIPAATDLVAKTADQLMFSKADSSSGLERSAWAQSGFETFVRTFGLGAGPGSLRSNGLAAVLLGTVGLPGTLCFLLFLWFSFGQPPASRHSDETRAFIAARVSALTMLTAMGLSATVPDPSLHLTFLAGLAVASRERQYQPRRRAERLRPSPARYHPPPQTGFGR